MSNLANILTQQLNLSELVRSHGGIVTVIDNGTVYRSTTDVTNRAYDVRHDNPATRARVDYAKQRPNGNRVPMRRALDSIDDERLTNAPAKQIAFRNWGSLLHSHVTVTLLSGQTFSGRLDYDKLSGFWFVYNGDGRQHCHFNSTKATVTWDNNGHVTIVMKR